MKIIDVYNENKVKYPKYVIMIKVGIFYEVYGEEVYILNNLFDYKINVVNGKKKLGFPVKSLEKVILKLNRFKINYLIIDRENIRKKFNKNKYDSYLRHKLTFEERINNINNKLVILKGNPNIDKILNEVEGIIYER